MEYRPGLGPVRPLVDRLDLALDGADRLDLAVAYAKSSGVGRLLSIALPRRTRAVVGLGFGLTDPAAVEQLERAGSELRAVDDTSALAASQFHPKLYLVERGERLTVLSGSANLTYGGLTANVEQFEELTVASRSSAGDEQRGRFEEVWAYGRPLADLRRSGDWERYRQRARDRRRLELEDRKRLTRLDADTGRLLGVLARRSTRAAPGYLAITHPDWWDLQLGLRDVTDRALFWRRNTNDFRALANGGVFLHLVKRPGEPEHLREVRGFSRYPGQYEVARADALWRRYGSLLGVDSLGQLCDRLSVEPERLLGVIHLEDVTELDRPVPLDQLRANGLDFARNIVSGKTLSLEQLATVLELGGLGAEAAEPLQLAAEQTGPYSADAAG